MDQSTAVCSWLESKRLEQHCLICLHKRNEWSKRIQKLGTSWHSVQKRCAVTAGILQSSGLPPLGKHCPGRWLQRPEAKQWSSLVYISAPQVAKKPLVFDIECLYRILKNAKIGMNHGCKWHQITTKCNNLHVQYHRLSLLLMFVAQHACHLSLS